MAQRKRYYVDPRNYDRRDVAQEGARPASVIGDAMADMVKSGVEIARGAGRSQLVIRKKNGPSSRSAPAATTLTRRER